MKEQIKQLLDSGQVDVFLAYRDLEGHPTPHAFTADRLDELDRLADDNVRYPLDKMAQRLIKEKPELKVGLLARECTQRSLNVLAAWNQIDLDQIKIISLACCPSPMHDKAACSYLSPTKSGAFKLAAGVDNQAKPADLDELDQAERFKRWRYEFEKCIKCYGCRNICPVCFCTECSLENRELISGRNLPPETPIFHLARAVHMAGRCVDCGLCEEACPMDIPLRLLYGQVGRIVKDMFGYQPGADTSQSPFTFLGEKVTLELKPLNRAEAA